MNGPVSPVDCPNGHASTNRAVCTVCGAPIAAERREAVDTTPTASAVPIMPATPRAPGAARRLAAAPRVDPAEARHVPPVPSPAPPAAPPPPARAVEPAESGRDPGPHGSAPAVDAGYPPAPGAAPGGGMAAGDQVCPHCSAELHPGARFCEVCGYDPSTGSLPHVHAPVVRPAVIPGAAPPAGTGGRNGPAAPAPAPAPPPRTGRWTATITADRAYYESHHVGDVPFPLGVPPRTIDLATGPISIGRRSRSRGTNPAIDLAGPPEDPAVSHTHASLLPSDDGTWKLIDHGSTNGTYVNESLDPVPANHPLGIGPGDRIYVGAWTRITLDLHP